MDKDKKFQASIAAFLVIFFALSYFIIQAGQEDSYTVLYFSNPIEPVVYNYPTETFVNFTVENHENRDMKYAYLIKINDFEMVKKDITLKDSDTVSFSEKITTRGPSETINVSVQLYKKGNNEIYRQIWYQIRGDSK